MSKVVNIGVIIRNEQGDTFPVALNPQMVGVIQNLLMQIPVMDSKIVDPAGKKITAKGAAIPIIPREIEFDWDAAYSPLDRDVEQVLMKKLNERYAAMEKGEEIDGKIVKLNPGRPGIGDDPQNPFNLELAATGRADVDSPENDGTNAELIQDAKYPDPIGKLEGEHVEQIEEQQDVTILPPALPLSGEAPAPGQ